ncbi:unnamed protein product [Sympodiomycopsis kandeliae]
MNKAPAVVNAAATHSGAGLASTSSMPSPSTSTTVNPAGFSLPPPVDFDAIRRKQRAQQQQQQQQSNTSGSAKETRSPLNTSRQTNAHRGSPTGYSSSSTNTTVTTGNTPMSSFPDSFQDALTHFIETNRQDMAKLGGVGGAGSQPQDGNSNHQQLTQQQQALNNAFFQHQSQQHFQQMQQASGQHQSQQQPFQPAMFHSQPHPAHQPSSDPSPQSPFPPPHHHHHHHHNQMPHHLLQPQSAHTPQAPHSHAQVSSRQPQSVYPSQPDQADEQSRLLSSASNSFNNFAINMDRQHAAALSFNYLDPALANCFSDARNAAQTLCDDLRSISASLRSMALELRNSTDSTPNGVVPGSGQGSGTIWPPHSSASAVASMINQNGSTASPSTNQQPNGIGPAIGRANGSSSHTPMNGTGTHGNSPMPSGGPPSMEPSLLMSLLNGDGSGNGMLDLFGTSPGPSDGGFNNAAAGPSTGTPPQKHSLVGGSGMLGTKRKEVEDGTPSEGQGGSSTPGSKPMPKALGKHKSRPPIEGVRRESVRYRNRKLLVDMREQLYKWLDTTEFCRIARSYPAGSNGWIDVAVNPDDPSSGTRRVFQPNFEIGSDLYIANKELLEELIELGVQKVRDRPEAYGMKEGVNARDVVVDVAKDLMDSARHGYRANLKKQQEDEADAKAKSTRYKQQERHRTKVRNREVGAKRLKNPIPDALLTMGLHSDDAASDQEDMHKMDKEEWRKLRMRKLQSKRGWEALAPRWRNRHLTKAYHIADTLSKSKQMPRWRRDGGVELELPSRLWGKTLPKVIFDAEWLAENESKVKEDPYNVTIVDKEVEGWNDEDHNLSEDTEDELERFEREMTRLNRANRKHRPPPPDRHSSYSSSQNGSGSGGGNGGTNGGGPPYNMSQHLVERGRSTTTSEFSASRTQSLEDPSRQRDRESDLDRDEEMGDTSFTTMGDSLLNHPHHQHAQHQQQFTTASPQMAMPGMAPSGPAPALDNARTTTPTAATFKSDEPHSLAPPRSGGLILS